MPVTGLKRKRKPAAKHKPLGTIWEVPDPLWERIVPILERFWPTKRTGRHHANWRRAFNGILFRMRSGCQWDQLPPKFGPKSTVHDWFQRWCAGGVMQRIWELLAAECEELGQVDWKWQAADGRLGKARFGEKRWAGTLRIVAKRGPRRACWLMAMAAPWVWYWPPPT